MHRSRNESSDQLLLQYFKTSCVATINPQCHFGMTTHNICTLPHVGIKEIEETGKLEVRNNSSSVTTAPVAPGNGI